MKRPISTRIIALLLALLLAGCGAKEPQSTEPTTSPSIAITVPEETVTESTTVPVVPGHTHEYSAAETVQPTCTDEGYTVYACNCGDSYIDDHTEKLEHTYEKTDTVDPTSDYEGYTIYVCKVCFQSKRDDYVPALEEELNAVQRNSINMLNYLATIAERINVSKGNRLMLETVYTVLLNNVNPGKIDEETQAHMEDLRYIISNFIQISNERERLQYLHNQDKGAAIRSAVPDPLSILSVSNSLDWKRLATAVVFTVVDSYNNYAAATDTLERELLIGTWELDDKETATIRRNREHYFDYMVDIVQKYQFDGNLTLNENAVKKFAEICESDDITGKVQFFESEKSTYEHFGSYWLELTDCYYELGNYEKCLSCIETYNDLSVGIFRKDYDYAQILPKVIVAAQETGKSSAVIAGYADDIIANTEKSDWSLRYFAAQVYVDLYSDDHQKAYLEKAYQIALDNVNELKGEQQRLNEVYLAEVQLATLEEPDYDRMNDQQKKEAKAEYKAEKKRVDAYNEALKDTRKTELPPLYDPLIVSCDLLFTVADKLNISNERQVWIEDLLKTNTNGVFLSDAINNRYSFGTHGKDYSITLNAKTIEIPANLLTQGATIEVVVNAQGKTVKISDWKITKVNRDGDTVASFTANYTSESIKDIEWTVGAEVTVNIYNGKEHTPMAFCYKVTECKYQFPIGTKPIFESL